MRRLLLPVLLVTVCALAGCSDDDTNLPFTTPFTPFPPLIEGPTAIFYSVTSPDPNANISAQFTRNGGVTFENVTLGTGSPALFNVPATPEGFENFFLWDPIQDLGPGLHRNVVLRVFGFQRDLGLAGDTAPLIVDLTDRLDAVAGLPAHSGSVIAPLPDGSVWVAGGQQGGTVTAQGYRYEPQTNTFVGSDGLRGARRDAGSARLTDGGVLVAGGRGGNSAAQPNAEVFRLDSAGNGATRDVPGGLAIARTAPAVAALPNGQGIVVGGASPGGPSPQAERFVPDATGGDFVLAVSDASLARTGATATALIDGRVWVAGGFDAAGQPLSSTVLIDSSGSTVTAGPTLGNPRGEHAAVRLADGRVALIGGSSRAGDDLAALAVVDLFDPETNTTTPLPNLQRARRGCGAAYTRGSLIVFGGSGATGTPGTSERFALTDTSWSLVRVPGLSRPEARAVRSGAGQLIVVGGDQVAERYWPRGFAATEAFDLLVEATLPRARHTATLLGDGEVIAAGGTAGIDSGLDTSVLFAPIPRSFRDGPRLTTARQDHAAVAVGGGALVVGGRNSQGLVATAEFYNPGTGSWEAAGTLLTPRADATASLIGGGQILVVGGVDSAGTPLGSTEIWDPITRTFRAGGSLSAPSTDHDALSTGSHLLIGAGSNALGPRDSVDVISPFDLFLGTANEGSGRAGGALSDAANSGIAVISGGRDSGGSLRTDLRFIDTRVFPFVFLPETRPLFVPRARHRALGLADRRTLLVGGQREGGGLTDEGELYSFGLALRVEDGVVTRTPDRRMHLARTEHTVTLLADRRVLIWGGFDEQGTALSGAEFFVPR